MAYLRSKNELMEEFYRELIQQDTDELVLDFCRKKVIHGTPFIFSGREEDFYSFRKLVANQFKVPFHEVYIVGSAKLGFSPHKGRMFDLNSDVDIAIVSGLLFDQIMEIIRGYQMELRNSKRNVSENELGLYHQFLEYVALGWIRPDKLPLSFQIGDLKGKWFEFFESISYGRSVAGNYKVAAGAFKSYHHLEMYLVSGMKDLKTSKILMESVNV
ncbi:hypothetical protein IMCC1989_1134 [gamma proteobacterium IMCC1989]|nr:hypothetical protein IMCC1989_1134 [gamma proteobacterium IMCC1989]